MFDDYGKSFANDVIRVREKEIIELKQELNKLKAFEYYVDSKFDFVKEVDSLLFNGNKLNPIEYKVKSSQLLAHARMIANTMTKVSLPKYAEGDPKENQVVQINDIVWSFDNNRFKNCATVYGFTTTFRKPIEEGFSIYLLTTDNEDFMLPPYYSCTEARNKAANKEKS